MPLLHTAAAFKVCYNIFAPPLMFLMFCAEGAESAESAKKVS